MHLRPLLLMNLLLLLLLLLLLMLMHFHLPGVVQAHPNMSKESPHRLLLLQLYVGV
jgi:hypothetical protein